MSSEIVFVYPSSKKNDLMDDKVRDEPVWQGFVAQTNELLMMGGDKKGVNAHRKSHLGDVCLEDDQHDSVRSIGMGVNSDAADFDSEVRESLAGGGSEGDFEYSESDKKHSDGPDKNKQKASKHDDPNHNERLSVSTATGDMVATWRRKSSDSSSCESSVKEDNATSVKSVNSSPSSLSNYARQESKHAYKEGDGNDSSESKDDHVAGLDDEEAVSVQEQIRQIKAQEEEFETFDLKIVHRKNK